MGRRRNHRPHRLLRGIAQNPRRLSVRIAVNLPALGILTGNRDARQLQRPRIRHRQMPIHAIQKHRMSARNLIQIPAAGQSLHRPHGLVPSSTQNPLSRLGRLHLSEHALAEFIQRLHSDQIHAQLLQPSIGQMHVRVVKSRHHKVPAQINDQRLRALEFLNLCILPHRLNTVPMHRNSLLPHGRTEL